MKKVSKVLALLMVAALMLAVTGCANEKDELLGVWKGRVELAEQLTEELGDQMGDLTVDSFEMALQIEFKEDDTYVISVDEEALEQSVYDLQNYLVDGLLEYGKDNVLEKTGVEMTTEELLTFMRTTKESFMEQIPVAELVGEISDNLKVEGKFKVKDGKLYTSDDPNVETIEAAYENYTIEEGVLTLTEGSGTDPEDAFLYPLVLEKVQ